MPALDRHDKAGDLVRVLPGWQHPSDIWAVTSARASASARMRVCLAFLKAQLTQGPHALATSLEGYLFPDTYEYTANTKRAQLVEAMVKRFREVFTPEMQARAAAVAASAQARRAA